MLGTGRDQYGNKNRIQNGSVSCIGVPAAVPGGIRAIDCENLIAGMLDLENASSNDQTFTHSDHFNRNWSTEHSRQTCFYKPTDDNRCA